MRLVKVIELVDLSVLIVLAIGLSTPLWAQGPIDEATGDHCREERGEAACSFAAIDFSGEWIDSSFEEDDRGGPLTAGRSRSDGLQPDAMLGNYLGIPYNDAGRQKGAAFDLAIYSHPAWMFRPHPVQYSMRGVIRNWRMSKEIHPQTGNLVAYGITGGYNLDRIIWMDGRPHPPDYVEHTYNGFSTGRFERNMLVVTTTHMKHGYHRRNGAPASDQATMTEYFIRHGNQLTIVQFTDDPVYLEEPYIRTGDHVLSQNRHAGSVAARRNLWNTAEEVAWDDGYLPHHPLGTSHTQISDFLGIPFETTQGGSETLYPEYRNKLKQLMSEAEAADGNGRR